MTPQQFVEDKFASLSIPVVRTLGSEKRLGAVTATVKVLPSIPSAATASTPRLTGTGRRVRDPALSAP